MNNLIIRKRKIKDLFQLLKITRDSFPFWLKHTPYLLFPAMVVEKNSQIAGFIAFKIKGEAVEIVLMAIAKNYRDQGLGSKLMKRALNYFESKGRKQCLSKVRIDNQRALDFYKKNGFQVQKILKRPILGNVFLVKKVDDNRRKI